MPIALWSWCKRFSPQRRCGGWQRRLGLERLDNRARTAARRWFSPVLEVLEARTVLSTLTVTNLNDSGAGSLRAEIGLANPNDVIEFTNGLQGVILLTSPLKIGQNLTIDGPGASTITISGGNDVRVFSITGGAPT